MDRAACQRLAAAAPRKDEVDRRQEFAAPKTLDHGEQVVLRRPSQLGEPVVGRCLRLGPLARLTWDATLLVEQGIELVAHREPDPKLHRTLGDAHGGDVAALEAHPVRDFLEVADGRGEADELDVRRRLDDDLLPDRAAREVIDVMDFVEDDVADLLQSLRVLINKVAQDLRRHDDDRGPGVEGVLAGDEANVTLAMEPLVVAILLVGQRFQRRRINRARVGLEAAKDGVIGDDGLAGARGCGNQHALVRLQLFDSLHLKGIERPGQCCLKRVDQRLRRNGFTQGLKPILGGAAAPETTAFSADRPAELWRHDRDP